MVTKENIDCFTSISGRFPSNRTYYLPFILFSSFTLSTRKTGKLKAAKRERIRLKDCSRGSIVDNDIQSWLPCLYQGFGLVIFDCYASVASYIYTYEEKWVVTSFSCSAFISSRIAQHPTSVKFPQGDYVDEKINRLSDCFFFRR